MTQLGEIKNVEIANLYKHVEENQHNPSAGFYASVDALELATDGQVTLLDPTNPTVLLLEAASVAASAAFTETVNVLRKQYPSLSETPEDLYYHMSDVDFVGRFASPATEPVGFMIPFSTLKTQMVYDASERCLKAIIPRSSRVTAGTIAFTLMYPIVIRLFDTGTLTVSYDASKTSKFQSLTTNIIAYETRVSADGVMFLYFQIPLLQVSAESTVGTIQLGRVLRINTQFEDQFYYAEAFLRNNETQNKWMEIKTTHSDLAFDRREPTVLLKVEGNQLSATLPQIYHTGIASLGEIKIHVYTTKGNIIENLAVLDTSIDLTPLDPDEITDFTSVSFASTPIIPICTSITTGGTDGISFEKLRERVIFNSLGRNQVPITMHQIQAEAETKGFSIVESIDVTTDRVFLATQPLPKPSNSRLITSASIGVETFVSELQNLSNHEDVFSNGDRMTISPKCLFSTNTGIIQLLSRDQVDSIRNLDQTNFVNYINANNFVYTPFHWVVDFSTETPNSRAYYLDEPKATMINFIRQNPTLELAVNSSARWIERTANGFRLSVRVLSGNFFKELPDVQVGAHISFLPEGQNIPVYLPGYISAVQDGERVFSFDINTNFDINENDLIQILDTRVSQSVTQSVWANLQTEFNIFICTSSRTVNYQPDDSSKLFGSFMNPDMVPITHESVGITLGYSLKRLWSRVRSLAVGQEFERHEFDVQAFYENDEIDTDPITGKKFSIVNGEVVFNIIHRAGEPILDHLNNPTYVHRAGDIKVDPNTNLPIPVGVSKRQIELDIFMVDGRYYFVTDDIYTEYRRELVNILLSWITEDLQSVQAKLLELTKIYFHPKSQLGICRVDRGEGVIVNINSEQSPILDIYVPEAVYKSNELRQQIQNKAISILDSVLSEKEINVSRTEKLLTEAWGTSVTSVRLRNLGGDYDLQFARLISPTAQLSLRRRLEVQPDGTYFLTEDIVFNFFMITD